MKIPTLKDNFRTEIRERGYDYYKDGRVKSLIIDENTAAATVIGNRNYKVRIDLKKGSFRASL